ncbi:DgaE family pyridoxal phosphate-dependent ammonia lyase [Streptomyces kunmingensis]|uniref:DgaE family pyridoxal phosphate-dependent ammonia lyase n=1 Tax=Streptomyces kunmingensis TaxID=68225 RepID=A0ABU6CI12_9ACTN|nr:DgaE family pyridoxal phosphate-dependent ammonia lyase [Streptomyces kunmingensis]MEB3964359.1 DgaE family pyridoxal phosphate-dependent ammonia lyase [Streptomyces kunmingensis]
MHTLHQDLGVPPAVNASGKMTALGGSVLGEGIIAAMSDAARHHVVMDDLTTAVGREIARATGTEDGCPTTGAASGVAIAVAAVIAGTDLSRIEALPDAGDAPCEVILPRGHSVHFGAPIRQMIALGGGRPVEVGSANKVTADHLSGAIGPRTAALLYVQSHHAVQKGMVTLAQTIEAGRRHGVPVIVDAAAEEDLRHWPATGADLVIYSGGKAVGGPTSGMICGSAALMAACRAQYNGIARPMKVGKETLFGLVQALREYGSATPGGHRARMEKLAARLAELPGITTRVVADEAGRDIHRTELTVDAEGAGRDATRLAAELAAHGIHLRDHQSLTGRLYIDPRPLRPDEEERLVAQLTALLEGEGR